MQAWLNNANLKRELEANVRDYKNFYMFNGIALIVLGLLALTAPLLAAEFLNFLVGILLLLTGFFQVSVNISTKQHWSYYISAVISIVAGAFLLIKPDAGVLALTAVVAIFMLLQGFMQLFYASIYAPLTGWVWMLVSGILSILLAILVYTGWPLSAAWFLGLLLGVNLISIGLAVIMLASLISRSR
jgi:uncharacterized membrane protein HdeD (DUF308 family)